MSYFAFDSISQSSNYATSTFIVNFLPHFSPCFLSQPRSSSCFDVPQFFQPSSPSLISPMTSMPNTLPLFGSSLQSGQDTLCLTSLHFQYSEPALPHPPLNFIVLPCPPNFPPFPFTPVPLLIHYNVAPSLQQYST